jgi:hypothetical protein
MGKMITLTPIRSKEDKNRLLAEGVLIPSDSIFMVVRYSDPRKLFYTEYDVFTEDKALLCFSDEKSKELKDGFTIVVFKAGLSPWPDLEKIFVKEAPEAIAALVSD